MQLHNRPPVLPVYTAIPLNKPIFNELLYKFETRKSFIIYLTFPNKAYPAFNEVLEWLVRGGFLN